MTLASLIVLAAVGLTWMLGYVGFRLGFAPAMLTPELLADPSEGLATGALLIIEAPINVFRAGLSEWPWLMVWFAMVAIPAGALVTIRQYAPGGPRPSSTSTVFNTIGAVATSLVACLVFGWVTSPWRREWVGPMPMLLSDLESWQQTAAAAAGLDVMAAITTLVWTVLAVRLHLPRWHRVLCVSAIGFALGCVVLAACISGAIATQASSPRSVCFVSGSGEPQLLLGYTRGHAALLMKNGPAAQLRLVAESEEMTVIGRASLVEWAVEESAGDQDRTP